MRSPAKLGLPAKFTSWRPNQWGALWRLVQSKERFRAAVMPTGFGKSLMYMAYALLEGGRTIVLTSTKRLGTQLKRDFPDLVEIKGMNNYECILPPPDGSVGKYRSADKGWCKADVECALREAGCPYYDQYAKAKKSKLLVSNYAYWMSINAYGDGLGPFDTIILDEAHAALDELSDFLSTFVSEQDVAMLGLGYPSVKTWRSWVGKAIARVKSYTKMTGVFDSVIHFKRLLTGLQRLEIGRPEDWVFEHDGAGLRWTVTSPAPLAEKYLFCGVPEVILPSATIRPRTLELLGVTEYDFIEYDSDFPVEQRPIYYYPVASVAKKSTPKELAVWHQAIDDIIERRLDRKGIIHSVSYEWRKRIMEKSEYRGLMITHGRKDAEEAIARFRAAKAPAILVSPSMTTGLDFPYSECEYNIIPKVPYPDLSSRVLRARMQVDKTYMEYLTMMTLVQESGRAMRAEDDQCETFILDGNFGRLRHRHRQYAPAFFWEALQKVRELPEPPLPLGQHVVE